MMKNEKFRPYSIPKLFLGGFSIEQSVICIPE